MGYYVPAGYSRITFGYTGPSSQGSRPSFGFGVDSPPSPELTGLLAEWWIDNMKPLTATGWRLDRVEARSNVTVDVFEVGESGTRSGDGAWPGASMLVSYGTGLVGRRFRGRSFLPGVLLDGDVFDDGSINSTAKGNVVAALEELDDVLGTFEETARVILHSTEIAPTLITSTVVQAQTASQRRRNRR